MNKIFDELDIKTSDEIIFKGIVITPQGSESYYAITYDTMHSEYKIWVYSRKEWEYRIKFYGTDSWIKFMTELGIMIQAEVI